MGNKTKTSNTQPPKGNYGLVVEMTAVMLDAGAVALGLEDAFLGRAGAFGVLAAEFFAGMAGSVPGLAFALLEGGQQAFAGELAVHGLGAGILYGDSDIRGQVTERHAGGNLVDVLAAGTGRAGKDFLQLGFVQMGDWFHGSLEEQNSGAETRHSTSKHVKARRKLMTRITALPRRFYEPSADDVAVQLLGQLLVRKTPRGWCGGVIVETEAYLQGDAAAHSFRGETPRNRIMFGPPGNAYVYFIYGFHYCVNVVCRRAGCAEAVLIRALEAEAGLDAMRLNRSAAATFALTNGPGKLCSALAIDRKLDGVDLCDVASPLFIARNPDLTRFRSQRGPVIASARIGITKAATLPLRFYLRGSPYLSRRVREDAAPSSE